VRGYLAVSGGLDVPVYLGSRATFPGGNFGGYQGRYLQTGDSLPIGHGNACNPTTMPAVSRCAALRCVLLALPAGLGACGGDMASGGGR
jgi:allophanate hydrolase subunit 2